MTEKYIADSLLKPELNSEIESMNSHLQELFNKEEYDSAQSYLESIKSVKNSSKELLSKVSHHIGRIQFYRGEYNEARKSFISALKSNSGDFYSKIFLADILDKEGKYLSSLKLLERANSEKPKFGQLLFTIKNKINNVFHDDNEISDLLAGFNPTECVESTQKQPLISILILCYNKVEYTEKCLKTLFDNTAYSNFEVIVIDNASVDDTPGYLETYGNRIKFKRSPKNLGFIGGNNLAAQYSGGEYIVFLNNDTEVQANWLEHLLNTFRYYPNAGAVGSMLIYPDGKLQEAGGIIFQDATGWNYGKNAEPIDSRYNFVREVDYCSGAALMVRRSLFTMLNGFDERFAPAYYEDTDICFGIRKLGYKVYYNPFSKVIHHEGATAGTDLNSGFKKYQNINAEKFKTKWKEELKLQCPANPEMVYHSSNRNKGKRVLIIDDIPPLPDRASGAKDHYQMLMQMVELGYNVTYVFLSGTAYTDANAKEYFYQMKTKGVEFIWFNYESWWNLRNEPQVKPILISLIDSLELKKRNYNLVYLAFWNIAGYFIDLIKKEIPDVPIVVDSVDIHFLREKRRAELLKDSTMMKEAENIKKSELAVYAKADCVKTVTLQDRIELKKYLKDKPVFVMPGVHDAVNLNSSFEDKKDLLFVGNFNHNPNEDAVKYFIESIFPLIKKQLPGIKFYVVGNNPTEKIKSYASEDIIVTGWVPEILPYLEKCRLSVVPLRYGAGYKGKVCETLSHGLPIVATSVSVEGMGINHAEHALIADDPAMFAQYVFELYTDKIKWEKFSKNGQQLIDLQFSGKLLKKRIQYMMSFESKESFKSDKAIKFAEPPEVSIVIVTHNQWHYTKLCLDSIRRFTNVSHEITVVDNASSDDTKQQLSKYYPEILLIPNNRNSGFPEAVNQGIKTSIGEYILLLNNDTEVTENWLDHLLNAIKKESSFGIAGPFSNEVSGVQKDIEAKYSSMSEMHKYAKSNNEKYKNEVLEFPRVAFLCTLIKKEVIDKIGGLDERFSPGNYEDDDFCLRAQLAGYKTVIAKDVFIHHYGSKSFKANGENEYSARLETNKKIFVEKWGASPDEIWVKGSSFNHTKNLIVPLNADRYTQYFDNARILIADKEYSRALENLDKTIQHYNTTKTTNNIPLTDVYNLAGNISLLIKDLNSAKKYFEEELKLNPNSSPACYGLGEVFYTSEIYDAAKSMYEWAFVSDTANSTAKTRLEEVNKLLGFHHAHNSLLIEIPE